MRDRRRNPPDSTGPGGNDSEYRSISIVEDPDGFVVDVKVDSDEKSAEAPDGTDEPAAVDAPETANDSLAHDARTATVSTDATTGDVDLPNELIVDGTDTDGDATYTVTVSGRIEGDLDASTDAVAVDQSDVPTDDTVVGIVHDGTHVYRYSGSLVGLSVDGNVDVSFGGGLE